MRKYVSAVFQNFVKYLFDIDTFNKLGYKAEINNYTASRIN